jgi:hypothetical protein
MSRWLTRMAPLMLVLVAVGCAEPLETAYGRTRGRSINGTGALAELFREQGHSVRTAIRQSDELKDWAEVIVRFAPYPGPPDRKEADWYLSWLLADSDHQLIYIPRDFDAEAEYWTSVLAQQPEGTEAETRQRVERRRDEAAGWVSNLPHPTTEPADPRLWFAVAPGNGPPVTCGRLSGPWARGIDAKAAAIVRHDALRVEREFVLLRGDEAVLAMTWGLGTGGAILAIANGSFLLNEPLAHPARRELALRVVRWIGDGPRHVAFLEGYLGDGPIQPPSVFALLWVAPFGWIIAHLFGFSVIACLVRAVRLGRPRPEPPSGVERPAAHAEALGMLLARIGDSAAAHATLETYRRWRQPSALSFKARSEGPS